MRVADAMMLLFKRQFKENAIGRKLVVMIVCFSSVLTFFITALQLYAEYRQQRADLDGGLDSVKIFLPTIAAGVWNFSDTQIHLSLDALVHLPYIERATITTTNLDTVWTAESGHSARQIVRTYPLLHEVRGTTQQIAAIDIVASLDSIYDRVVSQAVTMLVSNGIKTFLVAAFMFVIVRRLVTSRIHLLAKKVQALMPRMLLTQSSMYNEADARTSTDPGDELDELAWGFDNMAHRLALAVQDLHERNTELRQENKERRRVEGELQHVVKELSRTNVELERFTYVAAHDLQEPTRCLVSFSQLLERKYGDAVGKEGREFLQFIVDEALRVSSLVGGILEYTQSGSPSLTLADVDCGPLVAEVIEGLQPLIVQKAATLQVGTLPIVRADAAQLHQVLRNLISNALKFSRPGVAPVVTVQAEREGDAWRLEIGDNGIGIDPQYHGYVFEVFRRLHTRSAIPGTGVGLALCRRIVEAHGGRIWLQSGLGEGTTVLVTIPDAVAADGATAEAAAAP
jgi:signal transduction histidine kinase